MCQMNLVLQIKVEKIVSVECFPNKVYIGWDEQYLVHTNHIVFGKEETDYTRSIATKTQYAEMENQIKKNLGDIDIEMAQNFLRSHENFPNSICASFTGKTMEQSPGSSRA